MQIETMGMEVQIERVDDLPLLYGQLKQMNVQTIIDEIVSVHGNWQGLSPGWVITIWLMYILSEQNHLMEPVQKWVRSRQVTLKRLTGQALVELDFSDDRLALCLCYLHPSAIWQAIESRLGQHLMRVYALPCETVRLDATTGTVNHDPARHELFRIGKAKNGLAVPQFKLMLASLDPLGLPLALDVVPGNQADDPLYVPIYQRVKAIVGGRGHLIVGDSKMSAKGTRATIVAGGDYYLVPLAHEKDEPALLDDLLTPWSGRTTEAQRIYLPEERPTAGGVLAPEQAIAYGFEVSRTRSVLSEPTESRWVERLLVVRSKAYAHTLQAHLQQRLTQAERQLHQLTPPPGRGKRQFSDETALLAEIGRIQQKYRVAGLFNLTYTAEVSERTLRKPKEKPERIERRVRLQLQVIRNEAAIDHALFRAGWRIYATNAAVGNLALADAVLAYRDQYLEENVFRRLHGKFLALTPLYIQRDDHAQGLFHLLTLAARLLALVDYQAKKTLATEGRSLAGLYAGNPNRSTSTPTTERMLKAFDNINLLIFAVGQTMTHTVVTPLTTVQQEILHLLALPTALYTDLQTSQVAST